MSTGSQNIFQPQRGEIWYAYLDPTIGHEQSGNRPVLIISVDRFNNCGAELVIAIPITSSSKNLPYHVPIFSSESTLSKKSVAMIEAIRSISQKRLKKRIGIIDEIALQNVEQRLQILLDL